MRKAPGGQEFISKAIEEIQEARVLQGDRHLPCGAAHCPGEGKEFHVCIDIPELNRAASGSSCGRLVSADAGVRLTATSACLLAWRARLRRSSAA
mgnify:CR=1 FL=1